MALQRLGFWVRKYYRASNIALVLTLTNVFT